MGSTMAIIGWILGRFITSLSLAWSSRVSAPQFGAVPVISLTLRRAHSAAFYPGIYMCSGGCWLTQDKLSSTHAGGGHPSRHHHVISNSCSHTFICAYLPRCRSRTYLFTPHSGTFLTDFCRGSIARPCTRGATLYYSSIGFQSSIAMLP